MVSGLIPHDVLSVLRRESARQFSQTATWVRQAQDANGEPVQSSYSKLSYDEPVQLACRAVTVYRDFISNQGFVRMQVTQWYLPPNTGVREGDKLYGIGDDVNHLPPILSVGQVPDPAASVYELVTTGWRSRGAP